MSRTVNQADIHERVSRFLLLILVILGGTSGAWAENAAFDLAGPKVEMTVSRAGKTLPIAEVPDLQPGDRLWIHPDLPSDQSVRYLLVVAFLRGQFTHTVSVPIGFADSSLHVPRPNGTLLYIKLRDDPATVNTLITAVLPDEQ
jgi:hypothetical protein